jgi:uracil-DNA glycosylase family 4
VTEDERRRALDAIASEVAVCTRCRLHQNRTRAVAGEGHPDTEVVFVGEGPGFNEDRQGRPFVGRAGDLLEKLLASIGWTRNEVFIGNVVKCRPPDNRDPEPDEIATCAPYLTRQLEALDPALVVTLGRFSMGRFSPGARIGQVHGTYVPAPANLGADRALVYFMYHPAAGLRDPGIEATSFRDMAGVPAALLEARARRAASASTESVIVGSNDAAAEPNQPAERASEPEAEPVERATRSVASDSERGSTDPTDQLGLF